MDVNFLNAGFFLMAAIALLGSPGPAIVALVAIGREKGFTKSLPFYGGLQVGLAAAAAISAVGLFSFLQAVPGATTVMALAATVYLLYLAYTIAAAPVGKQSYGNRSSFASNMTGGFFLGITNPKAYVAFISLMASYLIIPSNSSVDVALKWLLCIAVMIVVDIIWLRVGVTLKKANLNPKAERLLNVAMGATILITAVIAFV